MVLHLLALGNSSSESFDAAHVRYPSTVLDISSEAIGADIQARQRPDGKKYIRGGTLDIFVLTGTWGGRQQA